MPLMRFEITSRVSYAGARRFGAVGAYEQLDGTAHFAVDPLHPANAGICDLKLAPRNAAGLVEFATDLSLLRPLDASRGNGRCIVELPNRGRRRVVAMMNCAPPEAPVGPQAHPGDGFLFARGYSVASIGWQWDVYPSPELLGLAAPSVLEAGSPIGGQTMVEMRPNEPGTTRLLADRIHRPLPAAPGEQLNARLLVRDWEDGEDTLIPRARWRFARETPAGAVEPSSEHVWLEAGFEPGRIYQLVYDTDRAPVAGLGLLAARDVAAFLRAPSPANPNGHGFRTLILYGISQTGRMQRHFLSLRPQSVRGRRPCLRWLARAHRGRTPRCLQSSLRAALKPDNTVVGSRLSVCRRGDVRSADRAHGRAARSTQPPATCRRPSPPTVPRSTGGATPRSRTSTRRAGTTSLSTP